MQENDPDTGAARPRRPSVPAFNLPPLVACMILAAVLVHLLRSISVFLDQFFYGSFVFIPLPFLSGAPLGLLDWAGLFGHWLLHVSLMHLVMNMVMMAVFGRLLEIHWGRWPIFLVFMAAVAAGGIFEGLFGGNPHVRLVGASGGTMGLIGAVIGISWAMPGYAKGQIAGLVRLAWLLMAFNVVLPATGILELGGMLVSWLSHLGGAVAGAILGFLVERYFYRRRYGPG